MSADFDLASDFAAVADGLRPVTLTRPGTGLAIQVPGALRRAVLRRETLDSDGRYTASDFVWHLPAEVLAESPQAGDILIDENGNPWTILGARPATFGSRWHCVCRNLVAAHGLNLTVDIRRAVITKTDAGAEQFSWQPWLTGLAARVQPVGTTLDISDERTETVNLFRIYLLADIQIDATCRVFASDGTSYRILAGHRRDHLDELMYLEAVQTP